MTPFISSHRAQTIEGGYLHRMLSPTFLFMNGERLMKDMDGPLVDT